MNFFIVFWVIAIAEIITFAIVGDVIGGGLTFLLVIIAAVSGVTIIRKQGTGALAAVQDSLQKGGFPADEIFNGFCQVVAGLLLIFPGFLTDIVALLLLWPQSRHRFQNMMSTGDHRLKKSAPMRSDIEGEYETIDPKSQDD